MTKFEEIRSCPECRSPSCLGEFKKVVSLQYSGLEIYVHDDKEYLEQKGIMRKGKKKIFILYNAGDKGLKRPDYIKEMCQYKTRCYQCKMIIKRVRDLLDELTDLKKDEVVGVCEHCRRPNPFGKCKRCEYMVNKFLNNKAEQRRRKQERFKAWLNKVNELLQDVLANENLSRYEMFRKTSSIDELQKLLQELKSPLAMRQPNIPFFPKIESGHFIPLKALERNKELLVDLLRKMRSENNQARTSDESLHGSHSECCVGKYLMDKHFQQRRLKEMLSQEAHLLVEASVSQALQEKKSDAKSTKEMSEETTKKWIKIAPENEPQAKLTARKSTISQGKKLAKDNITQHEKYSKDQEMVSKEEKSQKLEKALNVKHVKRLGKENIAPPGKYSKETNGRMVSKVEMPPKCEMGPENDLILKLIKEYRKEKSEKVYQDKIKPRVFPKIDPLPMLPIIHTVPVAKEVENELSEVVECAHDDDGGRNEMIKGNSIVRFDPHYKDEPPPEIVPLLYELQVECTDTAASTEAIAKISTPSEEKVKNPGMTVNESQPNRILFYKLSNHEFIEKGWTVLPTTKVMRKMNVYKMEPASPQFDWFELHKNQCLFYDTGEMLAEINENGRGKWFYKNGRIALDYYNTEDLNAGQRYVVYSSGQEVEFVNNLPITVLASFDFLGNGVVYDSYGKARLKFNQTKGVILDEKIGPPSRWQWHSLNEPPVLRQAFTDKYDKRSECLEKFLNSYKEPKGTLQKSLVKKPNEDMLAIEFENFVKEKTHKLKQKFQPFQIRTKVVKINGQFSLRIVSQSNIYLLFRDGKICFKLNLGMKINSTEIIDTDTSEVSDVATPYDRHPPKSRSVADIQKNLQRTRRFVRSHENRKRSINRL